MNYSKYLVVNVIDSTIQISWVDSEYTKDSVDLFNTRFINELIGYSKIRMSRKKLKYHCQILAINVCCCLLFLPDQVAISVCFNL